MSVERGSGGRMKWIETAGGPFVLVNLDDVPLWRGCEGDYQQACEVDEITGLVSFGDPERQRIALVFGDEPLSTAYLTEHQAFVQWLYADSEEELIEMVDSQISLAVWECGPSVEIRGAAILFDAAIPGMELASDDFLEIRLRAGSYRVRTADIEPGGREAARVHQLVLNE
ncbi:Immunity protein 21 [Thermostaphylospora chromogena]|uniref:Immunity protein 21 n=2 Tax=Thermostaphylospora chromogena TaxID=35622 RepID=A0A1H1FTW6_9ACTN|nr:Immunity protein 21 [Thermostaphylospora chromogena]